MFAPRPRTFQRTVYRPGEVCQFDLWEPRARGPGRARSDAARLGRGRVPGVLARRRRRADLLQADAGSAGRDRALSVVAGRAAADAGLGPPGRPARPRRPPDRGVRRRSAASCGSTGSSARPADPQAKGVVERLQDFLERSFEPGPGVRERARLPAQLDTWFAERANVRHHKTLRCRPGRPAGARNAR